MPFVLHAFSIGIAQTAQFNRFLTCDLRVHDIMVRALKQKQCSRLDQKMAKRPIENSFLNN